MNIVFLDRDGTVIVDPEDGTVNTIEKLTLFPDTLEAFKLLTDNDFAVIFITNQAGIAEGRMSEDEFWHVHNELLRQLEPSGITILKTYMNDEGPSPDATEWRKPGPRMLLKAVEDFSLNPAAIYMVGDNDSDVQAAMNANLKGGILVQTATNKKVVSPDAVYTAPRFVDAVRFIVDNNEA